MINKQASYRLGRANLIERRTQALAHVLSVLQALGAIFDMPQQQKGSIASTYTTICPHRLQRIHATAVLISAHLAERDEIVDLLRD